MIVDERPDPKQQSAEGEWLGPDRAFARRFHLIVALRWL
jgi:hypothetical protein